MAAIVIVMVLFFLVMGVLAATVPYSTPALDRISNYDRVRFQAFREGFADKAKKTGSNIKRIIQ